MYLYSDDRSTQFNFNRQKSGLNKAFYGHRSSSVNLTSILKYRLDRQLKIRLRYTQIDVGHFFTIAFFKYDVIKAFS